jgi:hypothetical protein
MCILTELDTNEIHSLCPPLLEVPLCSSASLVILDRTVIVKRVLVPAYVKDAYLADDHNGSSTQWPQVLKLHRIPRLSKPFPMNPAQHTYSHDFQCQADPKTTPLKQPMAGSPAPCIGKRQEPRYVCMNELIAE